MAENENFATLLNKLSRFTLEKRAKRFLKLCCPKGQYKGTNFY